MRILRVGEDAAAQPVHVFRSKAKAAGGDLSYQGKTPGRGPRQGEVTSGAAPSVRGDNAAGDEIFPAGPAAPDLDAARQR